MNNDLFSDQPEVALEIRDADLEIDFCENFISGELAAQFYFDLFATTLWTQPEIQMYGKSILIPRLTSWFGDAGAAYRYSGIKNVPQPWTPALQDLRSRVEQRVGEEFNSVLLNFYRGGQDHISWHSDNEKELGSCPAIASLSFGGARKFAIRTVHSAARQKIYELPLTSGSLMCMRGRTQDSWQHCIRKTSQIAEPRINLTFRKVLSR